MGPKVQKAIIASGIVAAVVLAWWLFGPIWPTRKLPPPQVLQQQIVQSESHAVGSSGSGNSTGVGAGHAAVAAHTGSSGSSTGTPGDTQPNPNHQPAESVPEDHVARQAARELLQHGKGARGMAGRTLEQYRGNDPEVLITLVQATAKAGDWESVPRLVELMEHPDVRVRGKAGAAVRIIMGADYGFRAEDPPHKRREAIRLINQIYPTMKHKLQQHYGTAPAP